MGGESLEGPVERVASRNGITVDELSGSSRPRTVCSTRLDLVELAAVEGGLDESGCTGRYAPPLQGSTTSRPSISSKSVALRVANGIRCASAIAAVWASSALIGRPARVRAATMRA